LAATPYGITASNHRLRHGLPGYLILFATHAFEPQRQLQTRQPHAYFVFNLREDILAGVHKGDKIRIRVPALNNQEVEAEVRYIAPLGDYATKRATRATGDFDLKTFEVRLYPLQKVPNMRQGMSALWNWKE